MSEELRLFTVRRQPLQASVSRLLFVIALVMVYVIVMAVTSSGGVFYVVILPVFAVIFLLLLSVRQWSQPKAVAINERGILLRMAGGEIVYEWGKVEDIRIRTWQEDHALARFNVRLSGLDPSLPFVEIRLRKWVRANPFGLLQLPVPVPFVSLLGFYLEDAEAFVAAARGRLPA